MDKKIIVRADIPDDSDDRKDLVTNGLENGVSCFILRKGDEKFEDLGKMEAIYSENGIPCDDSYAVCNIDSPESQEKALSFAGKKKGVFVETGDWTIIPLENMIAAYGTTDTKIYAATDNKEDGETYLKTMEKGVDGIVITVDDPLKLSSFRDLLMSCGSEELSEIEIVSVKPIDMGDRVCIDTCSMMVPGEGMLIGSYSNCLFLVQSESEDNGYVAARPFRVNAGAVHSYIEVPGGGTRYLSELTGGDPVLICGKDGKTRSASVGRCKVEIRPLLIIEATDGRKNYSVVLQNAETIKLVTSEGSKSVTKLEKGDKVLAKISTGGRHFGMAVDETITEK